MKETTLVFPSWRMLWVFQRSAGVDRFSIQFRNRQITGGFSKTDVDRAVNNMGASVKPGGMHPA